jgi:thymidylate synthase (FAD)
MQIVEPSYKIEYPTSADEVLQDLKRVERIARTCYKSENKIDVNTYALMIDRLRDKGHHAMLEHAIISVRFVCDRGVSHELVRHRLASFAQESTRYCNYAGKGIQVICPPEIKKFKDEDLLYNPFNLWFECMEKIEETYDYMVRINELAPHIARSVLPTCVKTEIIVTANYREWRHIFQLRTPVTAHPQMRQLMIPLLVELKTKIPVIFDDIQIPAMPEGY